MATAIDSEFIKNLQYDVSKMQKSENRKHDCENMVSCRHFQTGLRKEVLRNQ
ncbi:hypothetical protein HMPREF1051_2402 [Neisseria sicca VK64]|uniref:Uncharacterized protein n=1 Tax=Neisseria sicca VK64 TaxID=1095748 RepID=I2NN16_NEISI|nr:hypothetical protein HMPREF1051_2402 [Neisseria sicca VK64]